MLQDTGNTSRHRPSRRSEKNPEVSAPTGDWCRAVEALPITDRTLKMMLHIVARSCEPNGTTTYLRKVDLAFGLGVTERHVTRLREKARDLGYLSWRHRGSRKGRLNDRLQLHVDPLTHKQFSALVQKDLEEKEKLRQSLFWKLKKTPAGPGAQQDISGDQGDISASSNETSESQQLDTTKSCESPQGDSPPSITSEDHRAPAGAQENKDGKSRSRRSTTNHTKPNQNATSPIPPAARRHLRRPVAQQDLDDHVRDGVDDGNQGFDQDRHGSNPFQKNADIPQAALS